MYTWDKMNKVFATIGQDLVVVRHVIIASYLNLSSKSTAAQSNR